MVSTPLDDSLKTLNYKMEFFL